MEPQGCQTKSYYLLGGVILLGLGLRLLLAMGAEVVLRSDSLEYHEYAVHLLQERRYYIIYHGPQPGFWGFEFRSRRPPGYPFFVAAIYSVMGINPRAVFVVQALLDTFSVALVYWLGRRFLAGPGLYIAVLGFALYAYRVSLLMTEVLFLPLFLGQLLVLTSKGQRSRLGGNLAAGLMFGTSLLIRPNFVIFAPLIAAYYFATMKTRRALLLLAAWGMVTLAVITPWLVRDYRLHGRFVWFSTLGGRTFHEGNDLPENATNVILAARGRGLTEVELDQFLYRHTIEHLKKHPDHAFRMMFRRLRNLWSLEMTGEIKNLLLEPLMGSPHPGKRALGALAFFLFFLSRVIQVVGIIGAIVLLPQWRKWMIFYAVPVWLSLQHFLAFQGSARYLAPVFPLFCLFGGALIEKLPSWHLRKKPTTPL